METSSGPTEGRLAGKVALITGGARGQGAAEGPLFAAEGARVYLTDVLTEEGQATADEIGDAATFLAHDVTSEAEWAVAMETILAEEGQLDVLVNNAGIFRIRTMSDTDLDMWNQIMAINQTGVFLGMRTAAVPMKAAGSGSIINISSIAGLRGTGGAFAYGASKWAVRGMTKSAAQELTPRGVRVNSVHPGIIDTPMANEFGGDVEATMVPRIPAGRLASADEVAKMVLFLASDDSDYCSGHEFVIDGAMTA
jgi:3alpha(or 20beta)-hydroxysteroid dehydrogenase